MPLASPGSPAVLPVGGSLGQVLKKSSASNFDVEWGDPATGDLSDGDKGDITVSASGSTWTIDDGVVTLAKQASIASGSVVYRKTAGSGPPEIQTLATLKTDLGLAGTNSGDSAYNPPRVSSATSMATLTVDAGTTDVAILTAQAEALTIAAPTGSPVQGQKLIIRIKDDGTARALTWNSVFREFGAGKPTTTAIGKTLYIGCIYNATDSKWDIVAVQQEV